jgi:enoyl-CoA hydratase/carnithine racemase
MRISSRARPPSTAPARRGLRLQQAGRVAVVTLSRPPVNALDDALIRELEAVVDELAGDEGVTVLHVRSDQHAFCAGADLALMRSCLAGPGGTEAMLAVAARMQRLFEHLETAPVISVAEIGSAALGGGLEFALACDTRIAAREAKLGLPETQLGLIPGAGGTQRLTALCGRGVAARLILGAEIIDGAEAERLGIVQWAVPLASLADAARSLATRLAALPKDALVAAKRCIAMAGGSARDGYAAELAATRRLYGSAETRRRVDEFLNRKATGQGSGHES